ncbi:MAG: Zn-ribbon domain-containing OB-fold protein [Burkholderiaceae bacterium]
MSLPALLEHSVGEVDGRTSLFAQRCRRCGRIAFPVRSLCAACGADELDRVPLSPDGQVFSWTVIHRAAAGWQVPYVVALVDFPEGPRLFAQVRADPAAMRSGMPVRLVFGTPPAGRPDGAYYFEPRSGT